MGLSMSGVAAVDAIPAAIPSREQRKSPMPMWSQDSSPASVGEHQQVPVRILDRDSPLVPVGVARRHDGPAVVADPVKPRGLRAHTEIEDEQVFASRPAVIRGLRVVNDLQVPRGLAHADHK